MNDLKRILIIKGSSQYGSARYFCDELQQAFLSKDCLVTMLDLTAFTDKCAPDLFASYDMIFSFDVTGIELYNTMEVKPFFWTFLIDPPAYLNERLKQIYSDVMVSCIDRRHVAYIDRYYKNIPWTCFMPHGGLTGGRPKLIPFSERKYDVVIMGSLNQIDDIEAVIDSLKKDYDPLVSSVIEAAMCDLDKDIEEILHETIKEMNIDFDDLMFREFMYLIRAVDALRRYHKRYTLVSGLIQNGIAVDVWGIGWEQIISDNVDRDLIRLHGEVSYEEAKYILADSRILVNDMPPYYEGSHERVFAAMQCNTVVATDKSSYFEECFVDNEDILFYDNKDIGSLTDRINNLLADPSKAESIAENASVSSQEHTWASRAMAMLEIAENIHGNKTFLKKPLFKRSYSQLGEDMIVDFLFYIHKISKPSYIDIGAHDPYNLSNTAYFYEKGCKGINIEPNPVLFDKIARVREEDINLNIGIGSENEELDFYVMNSTTMGTFSREQAEELVKEHGLKIEEVIRVPVNTLEYVINRYNNGIFPDFLSLDAEGLDEEILKSIDYEKSYPKVICVETVEYSIDTTGHKETGIIDFLKEKKYRIFADTYVNTIFERWD